MNLLTALLPVLLGPLLIRLPHSRLALNLFLSDYLPLLVLFLSWALASRLMPALLIDQVSSRLRRSATVALLITSVLLMLVSFQSLRDGIEKAGFILSLFSIATGSLALLFARQSRHRARLLMCFIYTITLGVLSLHIGAGEWGWQAVVASTALAGMLLAGEVADGLRSGMILWQSFPAGRLYRLSIYAGPALLAFLPVSHELPQWYLLILVLVPLSLPLARMAEAGGSQRLSRDSAGASILFVIILLLGRILQG